MTPWMSYLESEIAPLRRRARDGKRVKIALVGQRYVHSTRTRYTDAAEVMRAMTQYGLVEESPEVRQLGGVIGSIAPEATVTFENAVDPDTGAVDADIMGGMVAAMQKGADVIALLLDLPACGEDCRICSIAHNLAAQSMTIVCGPSPCPRPHPGVISVAPLLTTDDGRIGLYLPADATGGETKLAALAQADTGIAASIGVANVAGVIALSLSARRSWWKTTRVPSAQVKEELRAACLPFPAPGGWRISYGRLQPRKLLA